MPTTAQAAHCRLDQPTQKDDRRQERHIDTKLNRPGVQMSLTGSELAVYGALFTALVIALRFIWVYAAAYLSRWLSPSLRKTDPTTLLSIACRALHAGGAPPRGKRDETNPYFNDFVMLRKNLGTVRSIHAQHAAGFRRSTSRPNSGRSRVPTTLPRNAATSQSQPCRLPDKMPLK